jgi:hypothetical protein
VSNLEVCARLNLSSATGIVALHQEWLPLEPGNLGPTPKVPSAGRRDAAVMATKRRKDHHGNLPILQPCFYARI